MHGGGKMVAHPAHADGPYIKNSGGFTRVGVLRRYFMIHIAYTYIHVHIHMTTSICSP